MIINGKRKAKAPIDREKINNLMPFIDKNIFFSIYNQLYSKEKKKVDEYIEKYTPTYIFGKETSKAEIIDIYKREQALQKPSVSKKMEQTWHTYMSLPPEQKNGIPWNGEKLRPAVFDDMYLAQCQKEGRKPDKKIYDHFWGNCVGYQEYEPRFCTRSINMGLER